MFLPAVPCEFLAALRMSLSFPTYLTMALRSPGNGSQALGHPPRGSLCPAHFAVFAKGKSPHAAVPWSVRGLRAKNLLSLDARCKDRKEEHF